MTKSEDFSATPRTITRADLAEALVRRVGLSRTECAALLEMFIDEFREAASRGENVKLSSFGTFAVRSKTGRMGRNPRTGLVARIAPRRVLMFKASNALKDRANGVMPEGEATADES